MNARISLSIGLMGLLSLGSAAAVADVCPTPPANPVAAESNPVTGHYFEIYKANVISWDCANANAVGLTYNSTPGHLATITSSGEDAWVDQLRQNSVGISGLTQGQVWIGGVQSTGSTEPGGGWRWVNNEGPIPGVNIEPAYAGWAAGEPNNSPPGESHLALGRYGLAGGWNDEGSAPDSIGGYIVEYDVPRAAACTGTGCQTVTGQTLIFPAGSIPSGATVPFNSYEFTDPRVVSGRCNGTTPLTLFGAAYGMPELRIPAYLCGSPKIVVVAVDSSQLNILNGTVFVENKSDVVLPGNQFPDGTYECTNPIVRDFPTQGDPQFQDVVVWQSTDPTHMLEDGSGVGGQFAGAAGEFTSFCGSSGAKVRGASYYVIGMHIDFGSGYDWAANTAANHDRFVALTRYKLTLLKQSIANARTAGALKPIPSVAMEVLVALAIYRLDHGKSALALLNVKQFLALVNVTKYKSIAEQNYNGEHVMRGTNIEFMLRVKVIPYGP